jgi:hypothetical protein
MWQAAHRLKGGWGITTISVVIEKGNAGRAKSEEKRSGLLAVL